MKDQIRWKTVYKIDRWASENDRIMRVQYSEKEAKRLFGINQHTTFEKNLLLNEGINELFTLICSSSGTKWDNTNARTGVGSSSTAAQATDTGLLGGSKTFKAMDATYPTYGTSQKATWKSTYGSSDGNHAWEEFTIVNASDDTGKNLNRKVSSQGTKQSGQTWELTIEITLS